MRTPQLRWLAMADYSDSTLQEAIWRCGRQKVVRLEAHRCSRWGSGPAPIAQICSLDVGECRSRGYKSERSEPGRPPSRATMGLEPTTFCRFGKRSNQLSRVLGFDVGECRSRTPKRGEGGWSDCRIAKSVGASHIVARNGVLPSSRLQHRYISRERA